MFVLVDDLVLQLCIDLPLKSTRLGLFVNPLFSIQAASGIHPLAYLINWNFVSRGLLGEGGFTCQFGICNMNKIDHGKVSQRPIQLRNISNQRVVWP